MYGRLWIQFIKNLNKSVEMLTCSNLNECAAFSAIVYFVSVVIILFCVDASFVRTSCTDTKLH